MRIVVTGGAGFAGSAACRYLVSEQGHTVLNLDHAADAASRFALAPVAASPRYSVRRADICDRRRVRALLDAFSPDAVIHMARDDGSGEGSDASYIRNNVVGTFALLEAVRDFWTATTEGRRRRFRDLQVSSTDAFCALPEVGEGPASRIGPHANTPFAASVAAADHLAMAWHRTYGLPVLIAAPSHVYGPYQSLSCRIPQAIIAAIEGQAGCVGAAATADAARDWLHVDDLVRALDAILHRGAPGTGYFVGSGTAYSLPALNERIVELVDRHGPRGGQSALHRLSPREAPQEVASSSSAIDTSPLQRDTGWRARDTIDSGLSQTVRWFLSNEDWWRAMIDAQAEQQRLSRLQSA